MRLFLSRLRSFAALPAAERRLALSATGWLLAARVAFALLPFAVIRRWVDSGAGSSGATPPRATPLRTTPPPVGPPSAASTAEWPHLVRRAVLRAARTMPGSTCLARALVAQRLLRAGGHPAQLTLGVAHGPLAGAERALEAHAWVESGGIFVAGDAELERYASLASFGGSA